MRSKQISFISALCIFLIGILMVIAFTASATPDAPSKRNHSTASVYSNEYIVRGLMTQVETIEAQIKDPALIKSQLRVTIIEACDAASDVKRPSSDVISFEQENCGEN